MNKMLDFTTLDFTTEYNPDDENQTSRNNEFSQQMLLSFKESGQYLIRLIMFSCWWKMRRWKKVYINLDLLS